jgi:hypothetical protein
MWVGLPIPSDLRLITNVRFGLGWHQRESLHLALDVVGGASSHGSYGCLLSGAVIRLNTSSDLILDNEQALYNPIVKKLGYEYSEADSTDTSLLRTRAIGLAAFAKDERSESHPLATHQLCAYMRCFQCHERAHRAI